MKNFAEFIQTFNTKISSLLKQKQGTEKEFTDLNEEISELMTMSRELFPNDVEATLKSTGALKLFSDINKKLDMMGEDVEHYLVIPENNVVHLSFQGKVLKKKTVDLRKVLKEIGITKESPYYHFLAAYLAQDEYYDYVQLYYALPKI